VTHRIGRAHRITIGTEFRHNVEQTTLNYDEAPYTLYIDHRPRSQAVAVNLQDEYEVTRWLRLNLAARAERLTTGAGGFGPKAALILAPVSDTTIKLLFSRAVRAPSVYERFYDSPSNIGNTDLTAERMEGLELNLEHYLTPTMKVEASLFRNTYRNLIVGVADADGAVALRNGLDVRAPGMELSWLLKGRGGVQARASYSALFDADAASQAWTSGAPKHLAKISAGRPVASLGLTIGGELQYESARRTHTGEVLPSAVVANLTAVRSHLLKGVDLNVSLFNLFDQRYSEPVSENHLQGGVLQDGRQFLVGLTWRVR
jgi:outer membrane receptor protein involved in Fe transport